MDERTTHGRACSRRQVILGLGGGAFAVAALAACSTSSGSSGSSASDSSSQPSGSAPAGTASSAPAGAAGGALSWERVNLGFVSAYVLVRGREAAVVDTGVPGSADAIGAVLDRAGPGWSGVRHVVLTHRHDDHAGSLPEVLGRATSATGYVGTDDLGAVTGPRPLTPLDDGAEVFGLTVVATPGHTPGHICVFDSGTGVLVAGDALNNNRGGLSGADPQYTANTADAAASVRRLAALPVRTILVGHGDPVTSGAADALRRVAAG